MIKLPSEVDYSDLDITSQDREIIESIAECRGWNSCLAEVQRLNSTAQPVSDGWVKCSDRMPAQHQSNRYVPLNLLLKERTVVQGGFDDGEFWMEGVVIKNVTRWMPLPAAPGGQDD